MIVAFAIDFNLRVPCKIDCKPPLKVLKKTSKERIINDHIYSWLPKAILLKIGDKMINKNIPKIEENNINLRKIDIILFNLDSSECSKDCDISLTELKFKPSSETD
jgi:hypothetical protein